MRFRYRSDDEMKISGVEWIERIPKLWTRNKLKRELKFSVGGTPSTTNKDYFEGENIWVTIGDLKGKYCYKSKTKISKEAVKSTNMKKVPIGSLLYSFKLSVGQVAFASTELFTNEAIASFYPSDKYNLNYWYYALGNYLIENSNENIYGAKLLNQDLINNADVFVPNNQEQERIAKFLDEKTTQFDTIISKKEDLIKRLEEAKKSLISEVVTGKVKVVKIENGYELEERKKEEMKDSGVEWIGNIPMEWEIKKIKYIATLRSGDSITSDNIEVEGEYPVYGGNGLRGYTNKYTHDGTYILIGRQGALCGNINYAYEQFWASEHAVVVNQEVEIDLLWLGELFRSMNLNQYSETAAQPGLAVGMIQNLRLPYTTLNEQKIISELIKEKINSTDYIVERTKIQIKKIKEAKQSLISDAVTGKIEILE